MVKINLLDWRQARREQRQKNFFIALGATAALGLAIVGGMVMKINGDIEFQQQRNQLLKNEIVALDRQIAEIQKLEKLKQDLLARMRIIEDLQRSRTRIVHFFDEIVATTPEGIYLTSIKQQGKTTTLNGVSESNGRVSTYIRNIEASDWFANVKLNVIKARNEKRRRYGEFTLQFNEEKQAKSDQEDAG